MSKREGALFIGEMADGDGLSLFRQVFEFHQPMDSIYRKKDIRKPSRQPIFDPFGFPPGSHALLKIFPKSRFVHGKHCTTDATIYISNLLNILCAIA